MKLTRLLPKILLGLFIFILAFLAVSLAPADQTPYPQTDAYHQTIQRLDALQAAKPRPSAPPLPLPVSDDSITPLRNFSTMPTLKAGWAKIALTPSAPTPTAGYGVRNGQPYASIHDSVFVRAIVLDNGLTHVAIVSADLLIMPPTVTARLNEKLPRIGYSLAQTYLGATHTHNSLGGWGERTAGRIFAGEYNPATVEWIADRIVEAIAAAQRRLTPARTGFAQIYQADMVRNRLVGSKGTIDPFIRLLKIQKITGETALLCTYAAHSTTIEPSQVVLSRDWPGALVDSLERQKSVQFAQYMAGAVGSMAPLEEGKTDWEELRNQALGLQLEIQRVLPHIRLRADSTLRLVSLPLNLREPQWRVFGQLKMRYWLWKLVYGDYPNDLKALRIGNTLLLGVPADFSGEMVAGLQNISRQQGLNLVITSFNGGYIGYVTPDKYYRLDAYETYTMNWFGPGTGSYFDELMQRLIRLIS
ncbi:MAG: neutral/alkaline non-lysosomal ceramidase N-terminal domain-containing protein [Cytophagaceae bacterium]|nr:neutral/alkaline non-lysosomal ceramidase N-terminal domain-containing protein [Cytophagaceae bacterium]